VLSYIDTVNNSVDEFLGEFSYGVRRERCHWRRRRLRCGANAAMIVMIFDISPLHRSSGLRFNYFLSGERWTEPEPQTGE
jgi:hypothetical protein